MSWAPSPPNNANSSSSPLHPNPQSYQPPYSYSPPFPQYSNASPSSSAPYPVFYVPMYMAPPTGYYSNNDYNKYNKNQNNNIPDIERAATPFNYSGQKQFQEMKKAPEKEMKEKTVDQIVNEFKAYTLPKLRLKRLIKIQALARGFLARRILVPRKKFLINFAEDYVDKKISEHLEDKIIPDLVLEIITYTKHNEDLSLYSSSHQILLSLSSSILNRVVNNLSKDIANEATQAIVNDILRQRKIPAPTFQNDPLSWVAWDMMERVMREEGKEVAKEACREITEEYIVENYLGALVRDRFVLKPIAETFNEALDEIIIEDYIEQIIFRLTSELATPLVVHLMDEFQTEFEGQELEKGMDNYIDRGILEVLMEQLGVMIKERDR